MKVATIAKFLFLLSIGAMFFAWGLATVEYRIFPYKVVKEAASAAKSLREVWTDRPESASVDGGPVMEPRARFLEGEDDGALILIGGAAHALSHLNPPDGCLAWITDRSGKVRHIWKNDLDRFNALAVEAGNTVAANSKVSPMGVHLSADGSLLAVLIMTQGFPHGIGLIKMDVDSRLQWNSLKFNHHWPSVEADGTIHVPTQVALKTPVNLGDSMISLESEDGILLSDGVVSLDPDGRVVDEFMILDSLVESGFVSLFQGTIVDEPESSRKRRAIIASDPIHLNDVRALTAQEAQANDRLAAGDHLVSLRNLNAVAVLDRKTHLVKWWSAGSTMAQHSPRIYQGGVLTFDNLGGRRSEGGTRLALVDFRGGPAKTLFPREGAPPPEDFSSRVAGHIELHRDGRRALVSSTIQGALWEVDLQTGKVLWEYIVPKGPDGGKRMHIRTAQYVVDPQFPFNHDAP